MDHFFPRIQVKTKKKVFTKNGTLFSPNSNGDLHSDADHSQIIGGDADVDHTQIIGGDTVKLLGGYIPPGFRHPWSKPFKITGYSCSCQGSGFVGTCWQP